MRQGNPMPAQFTLTPQPVRLSATGKQSLVQALDIGAYDEADVLLVVSAIEGTGGPTATIRLITGMQIESEDGWVIAGAFTAATAVGAQKVHFDGLLKYLRWELLTLGGTTPSVVFSLNGMLRKH